MRAAHVELVVRDLDASLHFYDELLGMIVTERTAGAAYLRGWEEFLHHSLVLRAGDEPAIDHVSFRVAGDGDLDVLAADFERRGCPVREHAGEPGQGRAIRVQDPLGFPLEFFHDMDRVDSNTQAFHLQRGAPILRFDHLNFHRRTPRRRSGSGRSSGSGRRSTSRPTATTRSSPARGCGASRPCTTSR